MLIFFMMLLLVGSPELSVQEEVLHPRESFAFVGDNFTVWCSNSPSPEATTSLRFILHRPGSQSQSDVVIQANTINATHVSGTLNITEDLVGKNTIVCMSGKFRKMDEITLYVQGHLHNVSNISLFWYSSRYQLHVFWDLGKDYIDDTIKVEVLWSVHSAPNKSGSSCTKLTNESCVIDDSYSKDFFYFFCLTISINDWLVTKYHDNQNNVSSDTTDLFSAKYTFRLQVAHSVKTAPPGPVGLKSTSSECVKFFYTIPRYFSSYELTALSLSVAAMNSMTRKTSISQTDVLELNTSFKLCGLQPDSKYKFEVRVKPVKSSFWSEPVQFFARTAEGIPAHGPDVTSTSYFAGPCMKGERELYVYWKDIPHQVARGSLSNFHVMFNSISITARRKSNYVQVVLNCSVTYHVEIYSSNKINLTDSPSTLTIPSVQTELPIPANLNFMVTRLNLSQDSKHVEVKFSWTYKHLPLVTNLTMVIYYCQGETFTTNVCTNDFEIQSIPIQQQSLYLSNLSKTADQFGFALADHSNNVRGITWTNCIFEHNTKPLEPSDVYAYRNEEKNSISVQWRRQFCAEDNRALILRYYVRYCKEVSANTVDFCHVEIVEGSASTVVIRGLDMDTEYSITVQAESAAGKSPPSQPIVLTLSAQMENDEMERNIYIAVGISMFGLLATTAFVIWFRRKCKQRKQLMKEQLFFVGDIFENSNSSCCPSDSTGGIDNQIL